MLRRLAFGLVWLLWIAATLAIVVPWRDFQGHTHWGKVAWIPFVSPPIKMADIVANVLIYMPFGYLGGRTFGGYISPASIGVLAGLLSVAMEATQLYSHWRFPSATDVTCNLLGAFGGIYFANASLRRAGHMVSQEIHS